MTKRKNPKPVPSETFRQVSARYAAKWQLHGMAAIQLLADVPITGLEGAMKFGPGDLRDMLNTGNWS